MICEYPYVQGLTGYRRGCRCTRCKQQHRKYQLTYQAARKETECFDGCASRQSIEQWAVDVVARMSPMERMLVAGLDV